MNFKDYVTTVPNFPKDGIMFRDITPLIRDGKAFNACIDEIAEYGKGLMLMSLLDQKHGDLFWLSCCL